MTESVALEIDTKSSEVADENESLHYNLKSFNTVINICSSILLLFYICTSWSNTDPEYVMIIFGTLIIGINTILIIIHAVQSKDYKSTLNACCIKSNPFSCSKFTGKWITIPIFIPTIILINILLWNWFGDSGTVSDFDRIDSEAIITFSYQKEKNFLHSSPEHIGGNVGFFVFMAIILEGKFGSLISFAVYWSWWIFSHYSWGTGGRGASGTTHALFGSALTMQIAHIHWFIDGDKEKSEDVDAETIHRINFDKVLNLCNYYTQSIFIITLQQYCSYFYGIENNATHSDGILFGIIVTMLFMPVFDAWLIYNPYEITYRGKGKVLSVVNKVMCGVGLILLILYFVFPIEVYYGY